MGRYSIRAAALAAAVLVAVCAPGARAASTAVTGLTAAQPVTNIAPSLHWNAFTGATAYRVVRDASLLTFTDATAGEGTHGYSVRAEDRAGNQAVAVSPAALITVDHTAPAAPAGLTATVSGTSVALSWQPAADTSGIATYRVLRDGQPVSSTAATRRRSGAGDRQTAAFGNASYAALRRSLRSRMAVEARPSVSRGASPGSLVTPATEAPL
ncbi:MAG TPA: hypothetical protein VFH74_13940 [Gaiellales bacterium]|nr:hypothetical protein [Gaiellales bacterium]